MGFEEALMRMKEGWSVSRKLWDDGKEMRLRRGKYAIGYAGDKLEMGIKGVEYCDPDCELTRSPSLAMKDNTGVEIAVSIGIADMLAEDWYVVEKDIKLNCMDPGGWQDRVKVRETLEGVQVNYGKRGIDLPNYVCIKDDEIRGVKRGSILRFIGTNSFSDLMYYYMNSNGDMTYIPFIEVKEKYQCYQEIRKTICEVVDEWHVRFKAVEKVPDVKAVPYRIERISEEEIKRTIDVNRNLLNDCGEKLNIDKDAKWQEFEIRVNGDVKEIKFENGVLVTIRIPKKG